MYIILKKCEPIWRSLKPAPKVKFSGGCSVAPSLRALMVNVQFSRDGNLFDGKNDARKLN